MILTNLFIYLQRYYAISEISLKMIPEPPVTSLNRYSRVLTQQMDNPAAKAMLYGVGLTESDMHKPQIGIASTGYEGNTCNMHLNGLSVYVKQGIQASGLVGLIFNTIGVSDGMTNGNDGMSTLR